jgi:hypothetical protein
MHPDLSDLESAFTSVPRSAAAAATDTNKRACRAQSPRIEHMGAVFLSTAADSCWGAEELRPVRAPVVCRPNELRPAF